jgi:hypothetical protein
METSSNRGKHLGKLTIVTVVSCGNLGGAILPHPPSPRSFFCVAACNCHFLHLLPHCSATQNP